MRRPPGARLIVLLVMFVFAFGGITVRLGVLQLRDQRAYAAQGLAQRVHTIALPATRGMILDRDRIPLAITVQARDICADPRAVVDPVGTAEAIAPLLDMRPHTMLRALTSRGTFAFLARQADAGVAAKVEALDLPGIFTTPVTKREYPAGNLASQTLGFVNIDGAGVYGLESQFESLLAGEPGQERVELSPGGQVIPEGVQVLDPPIPGSTVVTTIDRQIQFQAQQYLQQAVQENHAVGGTIIVMDPKSGDIYAMANYPTFDPNAFSAVNPSRFQDRALTDTFEPGSVNKIITAAAGLEVGGVSMSQRFSVPDQRTIGDFTIHDSEIHPVEQMTLGDIITKSSNIGASEVADKVGRTSLATYLARFGYGRTTGLAFPNEATGDVPATPDWTDTSLATISYGQGITVTPMQMASVYATVANGGTLVQPRLVLGTKDPSGAFHPVPDSPTRSVIGRDTAGQLTQMLSSVVSDGTGTNAAIPGYQVAGKTGTALIPNPQGGYLKNDYVASFIGFLPASSPRVVVAAIIDRPSTVFGGVAAAPLFQQVARYAIHRLGIAPGEPVPLPPSALHP
ncbi:MAG: penicillin-binding protein 2 [Actinomycetota bacterium]